MFFYLSRKKSPFKSPLTPVVLGKDITHQLCFAIPRYLSRFYKGENIKPPSSEPSPLWGEGNIFPSLLPPHLNPLPCGERVRVRGNFLLFPCAFLLFIYTYYFLLLLYR